MKGIKKEELLRYLEGHGKAEAIIKVEKKKRLPLLTEKDSLHEEEFESIYSYGRDFDLIEGIKREEP